MHKWAGLAAGLWLLALGVTGFFLDHRDWGWMWRATVPEALVPDRIIERGRSGGVVRLYRIDPENPDRLLAGGPQGLWWSDDGGSSWSRTAFADMDSPPWVYSIVKDSAAGWEILWMATNDGVWVSYDGGKSASGVALRGFVVNAMAEGAGPGELLGVVDRSSVFRLTADSGGTIEWLGISPVGASELPEKFSLSRFVHDLHFGRGIFSGASSLLVNDIGGVALVALSVTGFLFWILPRRWKKRRRASRADYKTRKRTMRRIFGIHTTVFGLIGIAPIVYLSITGILIDHRDVLGHWMRSVEISREWLTPVYDMKSWDGEIYSIAGYPGEPGKLSLGTRGGMYTSSDGGSSWKREALPGATAGFIWSLRRIEDDLFIGGMGSPNLMKSGSGPWRVIKGAGHMPSDVTKTADGEIVWKTHKGVMVEVADGKFVNAGAALPLNPGVPWFYVLDGLHSGLFIHPQWKWVNDIVSIMAILLCVTGCVRWIRRKLFAPRRISHRGRA